MKRPAAATVLVVAVVCALALAATLPARGGRATAATTSSTVISIGDAPALGADLPPTAIATVASPTRRGLTVATTTGDVVVQGDARHHGSLAGSLNAPVLAIDRTPAGAGYWLFARDGGVFTFGDAAFYGSTGAMRLNEPVVSASATPTGRGYWLFARDGGVFTFGDAGFFGSTGAMRLNEPVVAGRATPSGRGYWLVARDGGVFTFGDAGFFGSTGGMTLNAPIVDLAPTARGAGYWLLARDGGVFTFGDAPYQGAATGRLGDGRTAVAIERAVTDNGYWVLAAPASVRVAVTGDVHGERQIGDQLRRGLNPLDHVAPLLRSADAAAVNLETPASSPGTPQHKQYVFLAPPELLRALADAGVDVVSLGNNHALDHGAPTMLDTIRRARAAGLAVVGAGANAAEAFRPAYVESARGERVAFVGLSRVLPPGWAATATRAGVASAYDERSALAAVREAAAQADLVVVLVHWGMEMARCPGGDVVAFADRLHAAGAHVVAGHHPHVLQGSDLRPTRVTAFSLGNFVWYHNSPPSDLTAILDVSRDAAGELAHAFHPAAIGDDGRPRLLADAAADHVRGAMSAGPCWRG